MWGVSNAHTNTNGRFVTTASDIIRYLGGLTLAGGDHDGEQFKVLPWERRFVRGAFGTPGPAALSVARGNGKSALVAGIAAAVVDPDGPLHGNRRECVCVAGSFDQARGTIFEDVLGFLRARHNLGNRSVWRVQDSANRALIEYRPTGARVRCIGSDPAKAHGLRPALALVDEPAQHDAAKTDRMLAAIRTGLGKVPDSKLIALGTRPSASEHWFSKMLLPGAPGYSQSHAAGPDDPPFRRTSWTKANPSLGHLPSLLAEVREEAEEAKSDPSMLAGFRALRLNQGISDVLQSTLLDAGTWERIEVSECPTIGEGYALGLDLGTNAAMSAAAAYDSGTGALDAFAVFPELPGLRERGLSDGVGRLYMEMQRRGELIIAGQRVSDIASLLRTALERWGKPAVVVADRWREAELRQELEAVRFPVVPLVTRGMGFLDGAADVREFRSACLGDRVKPVRSLLLRYAIGEARVLLDPAGNAKLSKNASGGRRARARDDAAAAAILAVAAGVRQPTEPPRRWRYRGMAG